MKDYNGFPGETITRAHEWLRAEYEAGRIPRPYVCCVCGCSSGVIDPHAESYREPFGPHIYQYSVCYRCHMLLHCRFKCPGAWARYKQQLRDGHIFTPLQARDFEKIRAHLEGPEPPHKAGIRRPVLNFFENLTCIQVPVFAPKRETGMIKRRGQQEFTLEIG